MTIERPNFDHVTGEDIAELVEASVPEGIRLEFKREPYGGSDADKREFLKDLSALANTHGGHLLIGVDEEDGVANALVGIPAESADAELQRMEQLARSGIDPPIPGLRIRAIPISDGTCVYVLRVLRSWHPPHRVVAKRANRFYARNSAGVHEPSVEELRALFTQSAEQLARATAFRDQRVEAIRTGEGLRPLFGDGRLLVHIVPVAAFSGSIALGMDAVHKAYMAFRPLRSTSFSPRFNIHGFVNERGGEENHGYTQVFRNGCIEAAISQVMRKNNGLVGIPGRGLEAELFTRVPEYLNALRALGVPAPLVVMISFEGVRGAVYHVINDNFVPLSHDLIHLPECLVEDYGETIDYHRAMRPAFDALWNACNFPRSLFFRDDGQWGR